jgi:hypothetical protein
MCVFGVFPSTSVSKVLDYSSCGVRVCCVAGV